MQDLWKNYQKSSAMRRIFRVVWYIETIKTLYNKVNDL